MTERLSNATFFDSGAESLRLPLRSKQLGRSEQCTAILDVRVRSFVSGRTLPLFFCAARDVDRSKNSRAQRNTAPYHTALHCTIHHYATLHFKQCGVRRRRVTQCDLAPMLRRLLRPDCVVLASLCNEALCYEKIVPRLELKIVFCWRNLMRSSGQ